MMLPASYIQTFNAISAISLQTLHFWSVFLCSAVVISLSLVVVTLTIVQLYGSQEIDFSTVILIISGLLFGVTGFLSLLVI